MAFTFGGTVDVRNAPKAIEVGQVWVPSYRNSIAPPRTVWRVNGAAVWWTTHPVSEQAFTAHRVTLGSFRAWVHAHMAELAPPTPAAPTTLHERVAADDRTRAIEPPPYRPGNPMWDAGWRSAQAQAAALAATAGDPHMRILAMRPTAPKVTA
jgi:hypothetical protein